MRTCHRIVLLLLLLFFGLNNNSHAKEKQELDSMWNDWKFRISPFFWYVGFQGTIYRPPYPSTMPEPPPKYEIDVGFKDIKNSIKFALMLAGQYRSEHIVAQFNFSSLILESEAITPGELVLQDNIINLTYFGGDVAAGYRIIKKTKFELDGLLGLKFIYYKIGLSTNLVGNVPITGARDKMWIDPVLAVHLKYRPHKRFELSGYGDFGPAFPDVVQSYQGILGASYSFTKTFLVTLGYRAYHTDFPRDEAIFIGNIHGWIMRVGFQF